MRIVQILGKGFGISKMINRTLELSEPMERCTERQTNIERLFNRFTALGEILESI